MRVQTPVKLFLLAMAAASMTSCVPAAAGAAGAAGALYFTDRGASTMVTAPLDRTAVATIATFRDLGITVTETETGEGEREFGGEQGGRKVSADLERDESGGTKIEVTAQEGVKWNKDYAKMVLTEIVQRVS
jgi:hypothetical protein